MTAATTAIPIQGGGRPAAYKATDGKRVPSVTTITGRFKDSGALIAWAWKQGIDGKDFRKSRDDAAGAGTLAHALVDADIHNAEPRLPNAAALNMSLEDYDIAMEAAHVALGAFRDWRAAVNLEIVATEVPLISERYRFGGTLDAIGRVAGKLALIDFKTGKLYSDHVVQVSAYRALWEECREGKIEALHLLRIGREFGDFAHHSWPLAVLDTGWEAFRLMRELYDLDAVLKRAAA